MNASFEKAIQMGYEGIVIFGNPENYICNGFKSSHRYQISIGDGYYPTALLAKELVDGAFVGGKWSYEESKAYEIDEKEAEAFDGQFETWEKKYSSSQELFYIYSKSSLH